MDHISAKLKSIDPCAALIVLVLIFNAFFGAYTELTGCVSLVLLCAAGIVCVRKYRRPIRINLQLIGVFCFSAGYLVTIPYAVDKGLAFLGFIKFLNLTAAALICSQIGPDARKTVLRCVPFIGCLQMLFAAPAYFIDGLSDYFYTYGRFHGGFGYSNSFALFLLCGLIVLFFADVPVKPPVKLGAAAVLIVGVLLSGSRMTFILLVPVLVIIVIKNRKYRVPLLISGAVIIASAAVYGIISGDTWNIARFLDFSVAESTYLDRFLYYYDALPLILHHLFGLGYKGYQFIVPSVQTGFYSVTFVHCEYLQLILDIGVIPAAVFFAGCFKNFFEDIPFGSKLLLAVVALHAVVDFDFQFLGILLLLPLIMKYEEKPPVKSKRKTKQPEPRPKYTAAMTAVCAVLILTGAYLTAATGAESLGKYSAAVRLYPGLTMSRLVELRSATDADEAEEIAGKLVKQNTYIAYAYDVLARCSAAKDDYETAIAMKDEAIRCAPLTIEEYSDKFDILYRAITYADENGDRELLLTACEKTVALPDELAAAKARLSELGKKITDIPDLELSEKETEYIAQLKELLESIDK